MFGITAIKKSMKEHSAIFSLVAVVLFFQILLAATGNGTQINPVNIASLIRQNAYVVILAIGMMICILTVCWDSLRPCVVTRRTRVLSLCPLRISASRMP